MKKSPLMILLLAIIIASCKGEGVRPPTDEQIASTRSLDLSNNALTYEQIRQIFSDDGLDPEIVSKLELKLSLDNYDEIIITSKWGNFVNVPIDSRLVELLKNAGYLNRETTPENCEAFTSITITNHDEQGFSLASAIQFRIGPMGGSPHITLHFSGERFFSSSGSEINEKRSNELFISTSQFIVDDHPFEVINESKFTDGTSHVNRYNFEGTIAELEYSMNESSLLKFYDGFLEAIVETCVGTELGEFVNAATDENRVHYEQGNLMTRQFK